MNRTKGSWEIGRRNRYFILLVVDHDEEEIGINFKTRQEAEQAYLKLHQSSEEERSDWLVREQGMICNGKVRLKGLFRERLLSEKIYVKGISLEEQKP